MDSLVIPERLRKKLELDADLDSIVREIIRKFSPIIKENKLEFFPEYTDHGFLHINKTLLIANEIIPNETFNKLNEVDVSVIVLSIFLHDLGMHFTYESFIELISGKYNNCIDMSIDNKTWSMLWDEYLVEAKFWSAKKIKAMFNDEFEIKQPPIQRGMATENDKKFIGEFLRRHHPRIAYEICVYGFPKADEDKMEFSNDIDSKSKKVIGVVARSHGISIWDAVKYIESEFGREQIRTTKNVHAIYIMVILRMSDYLDMDKTRANTPILKFKKINSSISELEWIKHNTVDFVTLEYQDDPESIFVYVNEITESKVYLAIENLLEDMQKELDTCWAVLGKVYGAYEKLELTFRRIHSTMENKDVFLKNTNFIAERIKFDSNPDILKLLVQPLYGENPSYGIRELLQNAIDACSEKEKILKDKEELKIVLTILEDEKLLIIEENGIGMNKDILINYFLVAGASFRNSDRWKRVYCENSKATIPRSGRFGVGVFASFLLGDEIDVETIRYREEIGYKFNANIETDQIQVIKFESNNKKSGTIIKIKLYDDIIKELKRQFTQNTNQVKWNQWYFANKPELIINVPVGWEKSINKNELKVHLCDECIEEYWNSIEPEGYYRVDWTYKRTNKLYCNGIIIQGDHYIYELQRYRFPMYFELPSVSVIDKDANFPLQLNRNGISDKKLPFEAELVQDIYYDIIAKLLISKNISELHNNYLLIRDNKLIHPAIKDDYIKGLGLSAHELLLTKAGFNILHHCNIQKLPKNLINKIWVNKKTKRINDSDLISKIDNIVVSKEDPSSIQKFKEIISYNTNINLGQQYKINNIRIFIKKEYYDYIFNKTKGRISSRFKNSINIESQSVNWYCITWGDVQNTKLDIEDFERNSKDINLFVEYYYNQITNGDINNLYNKYYESTIFEEAMKKNIGEDIYIPYDSTKRADKYKVAFTELEKYMRKYTKQAIEIKE